MKQTNSVTKEKQARQNVLEDLFDDMYEQRAKVYKVNFIRGVFFGLGSALGGTLLLAFVIWLLTLFVNFPLVGQYIQDFINSVPSK